MGMRELLEAQREENPLELVQISVNIYSKDYSFVATYAEHMAVPFGEALRAILDDHAKDDMDKALNEDWK